MQPPLIDGDQKALFNIMPKSGIVIYLVGQDPNIFKKTRSHPTI